jgi:hypothetical protein
MPLQYRFAVGLLLITLGCNRAEPTKMDRGQGPGRGTDPATVAGRAMPAASSAAVASAEQRGTRIEGPRDENMGRNFEGRLQLKITGPSRPLELRYLSHGERGRLQIDRPDAGTPGFDAIFAGDQALVLDHAKRRYSVLDLDDVPKKQEPSVDVKVERASDRRELSGLLCYPWQLSAGNQKVDACVRGLPGNFDADKLETLSGLDVPAWVEKLIDDDYLPIAATVTENGREKYKLELVQYSPQPVPENELTVPANYQRKP